MDVIFGLIKIRHRRFAACGTPSEASMRLQALIIIGGPHKIIFDCSGIAMAPQILLQNDFVDKASVPGPAGPLAAATKEPDGT